MLTAPSRQVDTAIEIPLEKSTVLKGHDSEVASCAIVPVPQMLLF